MNNVSLGGAATSYMPDASTMDVGGGEDAAVNFGDVLKSAVNSVDKVNNDASAQVSNLLQGGTGDINSVMIAVEKADVSFQLMMQVRNKIVSAYQDIEKMQF
jgi:flagellar hook-basal body complex protein FliE